MRTANPTLSAFGQPQTWADAHGRNSLADTNDNVMTIGGTVTATSILLGVCVAGAVVSWGLANSANYAHLAWPVGIGGMILGLVLGLVITFRPTTARFLSPVYAAAEGLFLGVFSFFVGNAVAAKTGAEAGAGGLQIGHTLILQAVTLTEIGEVLAGQSAGEIRHVAQKGISPARARRLFPPFKADEAGGWHERGARIRVPHTRHPRRATTRPRDRGPGDADLRNNLLRLRGRSARR